MNTKHIKGLGGALLLASALGLAACGSDDGDSTTADSGPSYTGPTAAVQLSSKVAADEAIGLATETALDGMSGEDLSGLLKPSDSSGLPNDLVGRMAGYLDMALSADKSTTTGALVGLTETSPAYACYVNGTVRYTYVYADAYTTTSGDSMTMSFSNCDDGYGEMTNGSLKITINFVGDIDLGSLNGVGVTFKANEFKITNTATNDYELIHGDMTMAIADVGGDFEYSIAGNSLLFLEYTALTDAKFQHLLENFAYVDTVDGVTLALTSSYDFTLSSDEIGGSVTVDTDNATPFVTLYGEMYPYQGILTVTGANNTKVRLTTLDSTQVEIAYDLDGDGTYGGPSDPVTTTVLWVNL